MMCLKIKNRLLCLNPFILQQVVVIMCLKITNRLVRRGGHYIIYNRMARNEHGG